MKHSKRFASARTLRTTLTSLGLLMAALQANAQGDGGVGSDETFDVAFGAPTFVDPSVFRGTEPGYHSFNQGEIMELRAPYRIYKDQEGNTIEVQFNESDAISTSREDQRMRATFQRYVEMNSGVLSTSRITNVKVESALVIHAEYLIEFDQKRTTTLSANSTLSGVGSVDSILDPLPSGSRVWVPAFEPVEPSVMGIAPVPQTASNEVVQGERMAVIQYLRNLWPVNYGMRLSGGESYLEIVEPGSNDHFGYDMIALSEDAGNNGFNYEFVFYLEQDKFPGQQVGSGMPAPIYALMVQDEGFWGFQKNVSGVLTLFFAELDSNGEIGATIGTWEFDSATKGWVTLALRHVKSGADYYIHPYLSPARGVEGTPMAPTFALHALPTGYGGNATFVYGDDHIGGGDQQYSPAPILLDQIRFWKAPLTGAEMAQYADRNVTGQEPNLVDAWMFDTFEGVRVDGVNGNGDIYLLFGGGSDFTYELQVPSDPTVGDGYDIKPAPPSIVG